MRTRSASAKPGCAARRAAWSGQPRNSVDPLAFEKLERRRRFGLRLGEQGGAGHQRGQQSLAEPSGPEEGHRDVEALSRSDAAGLESRRDGPQRRAVGVDDALRCPSAPEVKRTTMSSAGRTRASRPRTRLGRRSGRPGGRPCVQTRRNDGAAGWRVPERTVAHRVRCRHLRVRRRSADRETPPPSRGATRAPWSSCASSSGGRSSVLRGTSTAPIRMAASADDRPLDAVRRQQADPVALDDTLGDEPGRHARRSSSSSCGIGQRLVAASRGPARSPSCAPSVGEEGRGSSAASGDTEELLERPQVELAARHHRAPASAGPTTTRRGTL